MRKLFVTLVKCAVLLVVVFGLLYAAVIYWDKIVGLFGKAKQLCAEKAACCCRREHDDYADGDE